MKRVQDKVAIITGGAAGLGAAIARLFHTEGAKVIITDVQVAPGRALAKELDCEFIEQDVTDEQQWQSIIKQVEERYGAVHILVNNAGIMSCLDEDALDPERTTLKDWRNVQRVNVEGVFLGCRTAIPALRRAGGGAIINMSSIASVFPANRYTAYGASKATVRHLTKSVAMYCATDGSRIRCNSVHPGVILTQMNKDVLKGLAKKKGISFEEILAEALSWIPQGEFTEPEGVAYAVLFLASDESKHITGTKLFVDGGMTMEG